MDPGVVLPPHVAKVPLKTVYIPIDWSKLPGGNIWSPNGALAKALDDALAAKARGQKCALEVRAGAAAFSKALSCEGWHCCRQDISYSAEFDMEADIWLSWLVYTCRIRLWDYIHVATECATWSHAAKPAYRAVGPCILGFAGMPEKKTAKASHANMQAASTWCVLAVCEKYAIKVSLENPLPSMLFKHPGAARFFSSDSWTFTVLHYCKYGRRFRKATAFLSNAVFMPQLGTKCDHRKHSEILSGTAWCTVQKKWVPKTKKGNCYPPKLLKKWIALIVANLGH